MPTIKIRGNTEIYYKDWGTAQPVVFSRGWPLCADNWEDPDAVSRIAWLSVHRPRPLEPAKYISRRTFALDARFAK